jgi:hypothetical protein
MHCACGQQNTSDVQEEKRSCAAAHAAHFMHDYYSVKSCGLTVALIELKLETEYLHACWLATLACCILRNALPA